MTLTEALQQVELGHSCHVKGEDGSSFSIHKIIHRDQEGSVIYQVSNWQQQVFFYSSLINMIVNHLDELSIRKDGWTLVPPPKMDGKSLNDLYRMKEHAMNGDVPHKITYGKNGRVTATVAPLSLTREVRFDTFAGDKVMDHQIVCSNLTCDLARSLGMALIVAADRAEGAE